MNSLFILLPLFLSTQSFSAEYRARPVTLKGEIDSNPGNTTQILEAQVPVYRVDSVYVPQQITCNRVECSGTSGDGTTGNWQGYFSVSTGEKPAALARAIKGIGERTAALVIRAGFFMMKPRSWLAFSSEIENAQLVLAQQGYAGRFAELVLQQYGQENAKNLGYYVDNACHVVTYPCSVLTEVERETFVYNLERKIEVSTRGSILQAFEKDEYSIRVGFEPQAVEVTPANYYNQYSVHMTQVSQSDSKVDLVSTRRNLVTFPSDAASGDLSTAINGLEFSGNVNAEYLPAGDDSNSRLMLSYKVCRVDWFGGCFKTQIDWTQIQVTGTRFSVILPSSALRKGSKHKVWYQFVRSGSKYYSGKGVEQKTGAVEFK